MNPDDEAPDDGLVFPEGMNPQVARQLADNYARQQMALTEASHSLFEFLRGQTLEQKESLRAIFLAISMSENASGTSRYYCGLVTAYLDSMHSICPTCERNHDDDLGEMLSRRDSDGR